MFFSQLDNSFKSKLQICDFPIKIIRASSQNSFIGYVILPLFPLFSLDNSFNGFLQSCCRADFYLSCLVQTLPECCCVDSDSDSCFSVQDALVSTRTAASTDLMVSGRALSSSDAETCLEVSDASENLVESECHIAEHVFFAS